MGGGHPEACSSGPCSKKSPRRGVGAPPRDLTRWERKPPLGPKRGSPQSAGGQGAGKGLGRARRLCLLKGCEKWFMPGHALERYCSDDCRRQAERWRRWNAALRYRATEGGKEKRRAQCRRNRERRRKRREAKPEPDREGHRKRPPGELFSCDRPGCYELFERSRRSPLQRFCCSSCRKALRRVELREAGILRKDRGGARAGSPRRNSRLTDIDRLPRPP